MDPGPVLFVCPCFGLILFWQYPLQGLIPCVVPGLPGLVSFIYLMSFVWTVFLLFPMFHRLYLNYQLYLSTSCIKQTFRPKILTNDISDMYLRPNRGAEINSMSEVKTQINLCTFETQNRLIAHRTAGRLAGWLFSVFILYCYLSSVKRKLS